MLWASNKRHGRSLGQMAREELGMVGGVAAMVGVFVIMIILLAVLALVVVNALAESPWGVFSLAMTIPIALFMGVYMRFLRPGKVAEVSVIGVVLLLLAIVAGGWVAETSWGEDWFTLSKVTISWCLIVYGFAASVLPVWLLLAPRDYLSTFMKVGTIALLAVGILVAQPTIQMPAVSPFATAGNGPAFAGSLFPFLFITIACGALSGFHALICSGTTPKLLEKESQTRMIGYGGMLTESFVAIMALVTACILDPHLYFAMNAPASLTGGTPETAATYVNSLPLTGTPITADELAQAAQDVGETSIISRTGGAPTLAIGISEVLHGFLGGESLKSFWYHFAIMFEALFILTTVDAGTRVARFMLSDSLGNFGGPLRRFKDSSWRVGAWFCSLVVVGLWGAILLMGVTDPLGGINTLFPLFGIANQLLAAIALTVVTDDRREEGPAEMGLDTRGSAGLGSHRDDDGVVPEDLLRRSRRRVLGAARRVREREGRRRNQFRHRQDATGDRRGHPQHVHPGHPVDRVRGAGADRGGRRGPGVHQGDSQRYGNDDGGRTGAVADLRSARIDLEPRRARGAARVGSPRRRGEGRRARCRAPWGSLMLRRALHAFIWWVTSVMGDHDYERYLAHHRTRHPGEPILSEREYWRERYAAIDANPGARCC